MNHFQVICIEAINNEVPCKKGQPRPEVGDICIVTGIECQPWFDATYYQLSGYPSNNGYLSTSFAILPDASADEMQETERESIVNIEMPMPCLRQ